MAGSSKENPTQGWGNPFFREDEHLFDGGEKTVASPVGSIFGSYPHDGLNVMDKVLEEQAPKSAKRSVSGKGAK